MLELKNTFKILSIVKKTKAKMWCDCLPNDIIQVSLPLKYAGRNSNSTHAANIKFKNIRTNVEVLNTLNTLMLHCFEIVEV